MKLDELLNDKTIKQKPKVEAVSKMLLDKKLSVEELFQFWRLGHQPWSMDRSKNY